MDRPGPRYLTKFEARQQAQKPLWLMLIGVLGGALFLGGALISLAGMIAAEPPYIETFVVIGPYFLSMMAAGLLMLLTAIKVDKHRDPAIGSVIDTEQGQQLFGKGDYVQETYKGLQHVMEAHLLLSRAYGESEGNTNWVAAMSATIDNDWETYERMAQELHDEQCALLGPIYARLGKPNPLKVAPTPI